MKNIITLSCVTMSFFTLAEHKPEVLQRDDFEQQIEDEFEQLRLFDDLRENVQETNFAPPPNTPDLNARALEHVRQHRMMNARAIAANAFAPPDELEGVTDTISIENIEGLYFKIWNGDESDPVVYYYSQTDRAEENFTFDKNKQYQILVHDEYDNVVFKKNVKSGYRGNNELQGYCHYQVYASTHNGYRIEKKAGSSQWCSASKDRVLTQPMWQIVNETDHPIMVSFRPSRTFNMRTEPLDIDKGYIPPDEFRIYRTDDPFWTRQNITEGTHINIGIYDPYDIGYYRCEADAYLAGEYRAMYYKDDELGYVCRLSHVD